MAFVHGKKYEENSSDFNVQVSHNGYWSKTGSVKVQDLELITRIKPRGTHTKLLKLLYESSVNICRKYRNMVSKSTNRKYILLGVDSIPIKKMEDMIFGMLRLIDFLIYVIRQIQIEM